ncbi:hypothetical protein LCGC14_0914070 [marine sediment metagenome]|uniref:Uncharacterized protein n=1 Tax=marine sediment metagenome TaxID=412755 RepID=A0A0F9PDI2_9ZZZZ
MKIAFDKDYQPDACEGGNYRWCSNLSQFLRREGHEIVHRNPGQDGDCDLFIFPERWKSHECQAKNVLQFQWGADSNFKNDIAFQEGKSVISCSYRIHQNTLETVQLQWEQETGHKSYSALLPWAYPDWFIDEYMPDHTLDDPFNRNIITWISKGWYEPHYPSLPSGRARIDNGVNTLKALVKLNQTVDFKLIMFGSQTWGNNQFERIPAEYRMKELAAQLKDVEYRTGNWFDVMKIAPHSKLNLHVAGLPSSLSEMNLARALPAVYTDNVDIRSTVPQDISLLGEMQYATEDSIYDALYTFWTDSGTYHCALDYHQEWFKEHRTDGLRKCWGHALEVLRDVQG